MIEYLNTEFYYKNLDIINDIIWLNTREVYDYQYKHNVNIYNYVYKIDGTIYTSNTVLFRKAIIKAQLWERLYDNTAS